MFMKNIVHFLISFSILFLIFSCKEKQDPIPVSDEYYERIQQIINKGELLVSSSLQNDIYTFKFEKSNLEIPKEAIEEFHSDPENWMSLIKFTDSKSLEVPFKGQSLDFIVKNITPNPSGINPLTAKVEVLLPNFGRIKVVILGKNQGSTIISHHFKATERRQHIPIVGLYADYENKIDLIYTDNEGNERDKTRISIKTEPLNLNNFPKLFVKTADKENMEVGLNLVSYPGQSEFDTSIPYMVDDEGEVRWILLYNKSEKLNRLAQQIGLKRTKAGTFISGDMNNARIVELDVLGNLLKEWDLNKLGYTFHHEITEAQNGNFLITVSKNNAVLADGNPRMNDFIIELDPVNNSVVHEWDLGAMLDTTRYDKPDGVTPPEFAQSPGNWGQNNSVNEFNNDIISSMRFQGVFSFTHEQSLNWIMSPHKGWREEYKKHLLKPVDRNGNLITDSLVIYGHKSHPDFDWSWGPHTPTALPNGNFIVFDNGYYRNFTANVLPEANNYSRVVEYKVDKSRMTVQQIWQYGMERGDETFAQALSGVQYLSNTGNILFCPGIGTRTNLGNGGHVIEIDPRTGNVVFELQITSATYTAFHRVTRMSLYPENL